MDTSAELGSFLRARRDRLTPEDVGLVRYGARRRVPGLRREELAQLAGVSVACYTRLEQGQSLNASDAVLAAIGRALRLVTFRHPLAGEMTLAEEVFRVQEDAGQRLAVFAAEPGSPSESALRLLAGHGAQTRDGEPAQAVVQEIAVQGSVVKEITVQGAAVRGQGWPGSHAGGRESRAGRNRRPSRPSRAGTAVTPATPPGPSGSRRPPGTRRARPCAR